MGKKKIALLAASWDEKMIARTVTGIKGPLEKLGWDLHIFMVFPSFGIDNPDNFGAYNIYSLPNYNDYEGFLLSVNVIHGLDMFHKYHPGLFLCNKPIVALDMELKGFSSVLPNGYDAMYELVSHLIEEHHCKELNYVGGGVDHYDNIERKRAFVDALKAHGIEPEARRMRDYYFLDVNGQEAYKEFKEQGIHLPDAVVCANDAMALGYCQAADADGYNPPEHFLITGYDNDINSREFSPRLSSVDRNGEELGRIGCEDLLRQINGDKTTRQLHYKNDVLFRGSCGCYTEDENNTTSSAAKRKFYFKLRDERRFYEMVGSIRQNLALATSEDMFLHFLREALVEYDMRGFALCINQEVYFSTAALECEWKTGFSRKQYTLLCMKDKITLESEKLFRTKQLYPDPLRMEEEGTHIYIFCPLQRSGVGLGYIVFADSERLLGARVIQNLSIGIGNAYSNLHNLENLVKINKWLDGVYTMDAMTNLYNRFGYMRVGYELFAKSKAYNKPLLVMFMDMDHLKFINDTYGHSQGDVALTLFSQTLKKCVGEKKIAIRYGGDEFLIIGPVDDAEAAETFKEKLLQALEETNAREKLPYKVEASIGYILTNPRDRKELDDYVEEADTLMYEAKKLNKRERGSNYNR